MNSLQNYFVSNELNMVDFTITPLPQYFSSNCVCFQNEAVFPCKTNPRKISDYVKQEKKRALAMFEEVEKHQYFDISGMKPCYGVSTTTSYMLHCALFRHQNSIKKLKTALKRTDASIYIRFGTGKEVSVNVYTQTVKDILESTILKLNTFYDSLSPFCISKLKEAEKDHISTLKVLENVIQSFEHGQHQLEINLEPPE